MEEDEKAEKSESDAAESARDSNAGESERSEEDQATPDWQRANNQCSPYDDYQDYLSQLTLWLHRPCDPASLGLFRLLFGLLMIHDLMNER